MATKEVMVVTPEDMMNLVPSEMAMDAYRFALANAGIEMGEEAAASAKRRAFAQFCFGRSAEVHGTFGFGLTLLFSGFFCRSVPQWFDSTGATIKHKQRGTNGNHTL